jgi:hypothetical protein
MRDKKEYMTRTIKFRGLRKDGKGWAYGSLLLGMLPLFVVEGPLVLNDNEAHEVLPESVGQFTGQYDKDGTEIFEGDVLQYKYHRDRSGKDIAEFTEVVEWDNDTDNYSGFAIHKKMEKKIIGSIHTHPELLEKEKSV